MPAMDLILERQRQFAIRNFGPHTRPGRTEGVFDHIDKELVEAKGNPAALEEWLDLMILAAEGAFSQGFSARDIVRGYEAKLTKLEGRKYPDWRTHPPGKAIEHIRTPEEQAAKDFELHNASKRAGPPTPRNSAPAADRD